LTSHHLSLSLPLPSRPPRPPPSTLFPYTTLFRSNEPVEDLRPARGADAARTEHVLDRERRAVERPARDALAISLVGGVRYRKGIDRKSTRLNSSHGSISYAVFCLKKKNINT